MRKLLSLAALCALLSGCADYAPGDDQKGIELQAVGAQVLVALREYMDQNARPPRTLQDLVPKYIKALPDQPQINYDMRASRLEFTYKQEGSRGSDVACHAVVGETEWICTGIFQQRQ